MEKHSLASPLVLRIPLQSLLDDLIVQPQAMLAGLRVRLDHRIYEASFRTMRVLHRLVCLPNCLKGREGHTRRGWAPKKAKR
jgi:hypothetical protein